MSFNAPDTIHFDAEVITRDWYSLPCRVVAKVAVDELGHAGRIVYAVVGHVQALEDVWDSDERLVRENDDLVGRLEPIEIKRLESEAEGRYERERTGSLTWQYARAMLLLLALAVPSYADTAKWLGPPIYASALGSDAYSTDAALDACALAATRCYEKNEPLNTGTLTGAIVGTVLLSVVDHEVYKRNKWAAWGMRIGVLAGYFFVVRGNLDVARNPR